MNYSLSDQSSIFGNTYRGVPNPVVPHVHEYPTRYHGSVWLHPGTDRFHYKQASYLNAFKRPVSGFGASDFVSSLTASPTGGNSVMDFIVGGVVGYAAAPDPKSQLVWGIAGGALTAILGVIGMVGVAGAAIYTGSQK